MKNIRATVATLATAVLLVGCGGDDFADRPADEIAETAKSAMQDLSSVHVDGEITTDGQQMGMDIRLADSGECTGTMDTGETGRIEVLSTGEGSWFRGDEAFWTSAGAPAEQVPELVDKWAIDSDGEFAEFCDLDQLLDDLFNSDDESSETYRTIGTEELDGEEVVAIEQDDSEEGVSTGYVRVDGDHYLVKIEKTEGEDTGSVTFSEFGEEVDVEAPAEGDVVDLSTLG